MFGLNSMGIYNLETTHRHPQYRVRTKFPFCPPPLPPSLPPTPSSRSPTHHAHWGPSKIHIILHRDIYYAATCLLLSRAFSLTSLLYHFLLFCLFRHAEEKESRQVEGNAQGESKMYGGRMAEELICVLLV